MGKLSDKPASKLASLVGLDWKGNVRSMPVIDTAVSVAAIAIPGDIDWFQTAGYHRPGDGGAAHYVRAGDKPHLISADGTAWRVQELEPNVRMFGAKGDGSDDTAAIEAAHTYCIEKRYQLRSGLANVETGRPLRFPPGRYRYAGEGLTQNSGSILLSGVPGATAIEITSDAYFLTANGVVLSTHVTDINFVGGKGAFRYTNTGGNVAGLHIFESCTFGDYTECAIGNNAIDHPYLKVRCCSFLGSEKGGSIGIAWGGYLDSMTIEDCTFLLNKYHLKLGPWISGSVNISKNDFIAFKKGIRVADIWIVPSEWWVNSGAGVVIARNKFGNENLLPDQPRIIVAVEDEASGTDRLTRSHLAEWRTERAFARGVVLSENRIDGVGDMTAPLIRSYIAGLDALECTRNYFGGGIHTYLCEFMAGPVPGARRGPAEANWRVELSAFSESFSRDISNQEVGLLIDPMVMLPGSRGRLIYPAGLNPADIVPLLTDTRDDNGIRAQPNGGALFEAEIPSVLVSRLCWLDLDARAIEPTETHILYVRIFNPRNGAVAIRRQMTLGSDRKTIRIPFVFPDVGDGSGWQIVLKVGGMNPPAISIPKISLYHAETPVFSSNIQPLGSGGWADGHIVLGNAHIWVDEVGHLRIKNGAPRAHDDGTLIGPT